MDPKINVSHGVSLCVCRPGSLKQISNPGLISRFGSIPVQSIKCQVPPGVGTNNAVILSRFSKTNYVKNESQAIKLDYHAPVITGTFGHLKERGWNHDFIFRCIY